MMSVNLMEAYGNTPEIQHKSSEAASVNRTDLTEEKSEEGKASQKPSSDLKQRFDSYEPGQPEQPAGIYEVTHDEEGGLVVRLDELRKDAAEPDDQKDPEDEPAADGEKPIIVKTTGNTDRVDAEIEQLKQTEAQLQQQIASADPEEKESLEAELSRIQKEVSSKDNDTYRRQHMDITEQKVVSRVGE